MVRLRPAPGDKWVTEPGGAEVLTRKVTNPDALIPWALGFGRRAEVLTPDDLRARVTERLRAIASLHAGKVGKGAAHG